MFIPFHQFLSRSRWVVSMAAVGVLGFSSCQNNEPSTNTNNSQTSAATTDNNQQSTINHQPSTLQLAVLPPFEGVDVPFQKFKVNCGKSSTIEVSTGTTIEIPAGTFVDKNGAPISGEVEIQYREFHDATDILASGIPMQDPTTGAYMETAGMFEINGNTPSGESINFAAGKAITVNMGSFNDSDVQGKTEQFDFFELKRPTCGWDKKGTAKPRKNETKANTLRELDKKLPPKPNRPTKADESDNFVFDLDVDYRTFPELKPFKSIIWEYVGEKNSANDPEKQKWVFESDWQKIELQRTNEQGTYDLVLSNGDKKFQCPVRPVLKGGDYDKALLAFEEKMRQHEDIKEMQAQERDRLQQQADLVRTFTLQGFGIYNWDIWKQPNRVKCPSEVLFTDKKYDEIKKTIKYFLITDSKKSVVQYNYKDLAELFSFVEKTENTLVAVLPGNKIASFTIPATMDVSKIHADNKLKLKMKISDKKIENIADIDNVLAAL